MSVDVSQCDQDSQVNNKLDNNVYQKFQKAHENMSNFKQLLDKFSTHRKQQTRHPQVQQFEVVHQPNNQADKHSINLKLQQGWCYSGETFEGKFHGYGILSHNEKIVYSGDFYYGKMHGRGRLKFHDNFQHLIDFNTKYQWVEFQGEFVDGEITGFGNLIFSESQLILCGYWNKGKPLFYCKTQRFKHV